MTRKHDKTTALIETDHLMAAEPMTGGGVRLHMLGGTQWEIEGDLAQFEICEVLCSHCGKSTAFTLLPSEQGTWAANPAF